MRVILTRHFQTISNAEGRILGWGDSPPCPDWRDDVEFVAGCLSEKNVRPDAIYSSDLERARKTAGAYAESFEVAAAEAVAALKEINYGQLQTLSKDLVAEQYPLHKQDPAYIYPDGESFLQMQQRSVGFLSSLLLSRADDSTVLIVSHAGVIRGLISHFMGLEYGANLKHRIPFRYIGDFGFEGGRCVTYNEIGEASGFVREGAIRIPWIVRQTAI